jgi:hypothetical protein
MSIFLGGDLLVEGLGSRVSFSLVFFPSFRDLQGCQKGVRYGLHWLRMHRV